MTAPEVELQAELIEYEQKLGGKERELVYRARTTIAQLYLGLLQVRGDVNRVLGDD